MPAVVTRVTAVRRMATGAIGCKRDAVAAVDGLLDECGTGLMRTVYVDAAYATVYKLPGGRGHNAGWNKANESEFEAMQAARTSPDLRRYHTPCTLYYVDGIAVLAMPYRPVDGTDIDYEAQDRLLEVARAHGLRDMHPGNYRGTPSGQVKITDLGAIRW